MANDFRGRRRWIATRPRPKSLAHLGFLDIEVQDADGTNRYTPNDLIVAFGMGLEETLKPIPELRSVCSGEPAAIYRTQEAEIALTADEMSRLVFRGLRPEEFASICDAVGATFELSEEFYDWRTGMSFAIPRGTP